MTDEQMAEIRRLAEAATPAPWTHKEDDGDHFVAAGDFAVAMVGGYIPTPMDAANGAFLAAARTAVPALLAEVARLQGEVEGWKKAVDVADLSIGKLARERNALAAEVREKASAIAEAALDAYQSSEVAYLKARLEEAQAAERERCAKVLDAEAEAWASRRGTDNGAREDLARELAATIRALK